MALAEELIKLNISGGLDTKTDIKQQRDGFLRTAENVVYETLDLLKKRNGYDLKNLEDSDGNPISDAKILSRYKDELLLFRENGLYGYSSILDKFILRGNLYPSDVTTKNIIKNATEQDKPTFCQVEGFSVYAWEDSSGGVRYSVMDPSNDSFILSNQLVDSVGTSPKLCFINAKVFIFYADGSDIKFKTFNILQPGTLSSAVIAKSDLASIFDCSSGPSNIFIAYDAGSDVGIFKVDSDENVSSTLQIAGESASNAVNVYIDAQYRVIVSWSDGSDVKYAIATFALTTLLLTATTIETIADCSNITIIQNGSSYSALYEIANVEDYKTIVKKASLSLSGVISSIEVFYRGVGLASCSFSYNSYYYVTLVVPSDLQSTYFIVDFDKVLVNKFNNQNAGGLITWGVLNKVFSSSEKVFDIMGQIKGRNSTSNGVFLSLKGISNTSINFGPSNYYQNAYLAENLHICAGLLKNYDGASLNEHGFCVFPENLASSTSVTGGNMSDGDRSYVAVYRWTDNNGRDHRSTPTPIAENVILSGGGSSQKITITVPTLHLTEKTDVVIELYGTEADGTIYYKITDDSNPVYNDDTVDDVDIDVTISDANLISKELLYTTGGVLENIQAPSCYLVTVYLGNRLAVVGDNKIRTVFSKTVEDGKPVEFTDIIYSEVDPIGGDISAIKGMNEKLLIFSQDATHYVAGSGPNNLLQGDNFTRPETIFPDVGALTANSILDTPLGVMFQSRKGIYLAQNDLNAKYVGDRVEAFNSKTITSAQIVGELNQIRFLCSEETALVYNYHLDKWAIFSNHGGLSSVVIGNDYYYIREGGALYKENKTSFSDASSPIRLKIETGWLSLGTIQGFQRVRHAMILGAYKSAHKLRIKVAYNFVDVYTQEEVIDVSDFIDGSTFGEYSPYGEPQGIGFGGDIDQNLYQARIDMERQKCTAIKILIEDAQDTVGEGLSLSAITFRAGIKQGENKLPATNKFGVS